MSIFVMGKKELHNLLNLLLDNQQGEFYNFYNKDEIVQIDKLIYKKHKIILKYKTKTNKLIFKSSEIEVLIVLNNYEVESYKILTSCNALYKKIPVVILPDNSTHYTVYISDYIIKLDSIPNDEGFIFFNNRDLNVSSNFHKIDENLIFVDNLQFCRELLKIKEK